MVGRTLFILEAIPSVILGIIAYFYLTDSIEKAEWLDDNEKKMAYGCISKRTE